MDDNELIVAAGRGDREAFGVFVRRHERLVVAFAARFLGLTDRSTAEDLAQDAFVAAWQASPRYRVQGAPKAWLLQIVARRCLNWRRGQRLRAAGPLSELLPASDCGAPEAVVESEARVASVRSALAALPLRQRAAILLRHFHEMTYEEIGDVLEISDAAVESLLFRARRRLEALLTERAGDSPQDSGSSGANPR